MEVNRDTPGVPWKPSRLSKSDLGIRAAVGAGTVLDPETGRLALLSGAEFLVAVLNVDVIPFGEPLRPPGHPRILDSTEIETAYGSRGRHCQLFPAVRSRGGIH